MRSLDPMRNFPELDGMPDAEAKVLIRNTQKRISREPKIFAGLLAVLVVAAIIVFSLFRVDGILGGALIGGLIGLVAVAYMVAVIKPRMREEFRRMGYPK